MVNATVERAPSITARQRDVIVLIAAGCSNEEVSERLGISPRTVKAHCDVLRQKFGVRLRVSSDRVQEPGASDVVTLRRRAHQTVPEGKGSSLWRVDYGAVLFGPIRVGGGG